MYAVVPPADSEDLTRLFNRVLEQEAPASHKAGEDVNGLMKGQNL